MVINADIAITDIHQMCNSVRFLLVSLINSLYCYTVSGGSVWHNSIIHTEQTIQLILNSVVINFWLETQITEHDIYIYMCVYVFFISHKVYRLYYCRPDLWICTCICRVQIRLLSCLFIANGTIIEKKCNSLYW